jgi:dynein heavy chain, axonemal
LKAHHSTSLLSSSCHCALQGVRRTNFNRIKQRIEDSLFLAKPTFCGHLRELAACVSEIQQIQFVWANPNHLYQLQEFTELQVVTREQKAKPALEAIVEKMQKASPVVILLW